MKRFRFYKESDGTWFVDLPNYRGLKGDLEMVDGADTMLEIFANEGTECIMTASEEPFEGADTLELVKNACGGGDYILKTFQGEIVDHELWLCSVIKFVYKKVPEKLYIKL